MIKTLDNFVIKLGFVFDQSKLKKVSDTLEDWQNNLKGLVRTGGFIYFLNQLGNVTQRLIDATHATADWATQLERTSRSTGVDSDVLERLRILEKEHNLSEGILENTLESINQKQIRARTGQGYDEGFLRTGIGLGGSPTQILEKIIEAGAKGTDKYRKYLSDMLGVDQSIFELYGQDISKIDSYLTTMKRDRKELDETNKLFGKITVRVETLKKKLIILLLPIVQKILKYANEYLEKVLKKIEEIQKDEELMKRINGWLQKTATILVLIGSLLIPAIIKSLVTIGQFLFSGIFSPILQIFISIKRLFTYINTQTALLTGKRLSTWIIDYIKHTKIAIAITKVWGLVSKTTAGLLKGLGKATLFCAKGIWAMLSPILLIVGKIALFASLVVVLSDLINVFRGNGAPILRFLEETIGQKFPKIKTGITWIREKLENLPDALKNLWESIKKNTPILMKFIWRKIKELFSWIWELGKKYVGKLIDYLLEQVRDLYQSFGFMAKFLGGRKFEEEYNKRLLAKEEEKLGQAKDRLMYKQLAKASDFLMPLVSSQKQIVPYKQGENTYQFTINNDNEFKIGDGEDKMDVAKAIGNYLGSASFKDNMNRASIQYGNVK